MGDYVSPDEEKPLWHHVIKLKSQQDIIGVFGRTAEIKPKDGSASVSYFVSLGFFLNNCENPRLQKMSHDLGPPKVVFKEKTVI